MADAWKRKPVVFEWYGKYDYLESQGWSFDAAVDFMLRNHATIINDNVGDVPEKDFPELQKLEKLAGARLVLRELAHETSVRPGGLLTLKMKMVNEGIAKIYYPYVLRLFLLNSMGQPVLTTNAKADPCAWLPGEYNFDESITVPGTLAAGEYTIALALEDPAGKRRSFRLAINAPEKEGRYLLSKCRVI
jgi:hypothetical protein